MAKVFDALDDHVDVSPKGPAGTFRGPGAIDRYEADKSAVGLDGLPALEFSPRMRDERLRAGNTPDTVRDRS